MKQLESMERSIDIVMAPLPFNGQKRMWRKEITSVLNDLNKEKKIEIVVDLFGGSGFCSYLSKKALPDAEVIYNDYDGYSDRLKHLEETVELRKIFFDIFSLKKRKEKLSSNEKNIVLDICEKHLNKYGYLDWYDVAHSFLFSVKVCEISCFEDLKKHNFYNNITFSNLEKIIKQKEKYLDGISVIKNKTDWKEIFKKYINRKNVLFIADPPCLNTYQGSYTNKVKKVDEVMFLLKCLQDVSFIFFYDAENLLLEFFKSLKEQFKIEIPFFLNKKEIIKEFCLGRGVKRREILIY